MSKTVSFVEVSKEEFWSYIMKTKRNVHPRHFRFNTDWLDQRTFEIVAKEDQGYVTDHRRPPRYFLAKALTDAEALSN